MLVSSILALPKFTLARSLALDLYCWLFYEVQSQNLSSMQSSHDWYRSNYFFFLALSIFLFAFHSTLLLLLSIICGIYWKVGCGAGNTIFPLVATYPYIIVHACDFSSRAIDLVKVCFLLPVIFFLEVLLQSLFH